MPSCSTNFNSYDKVLISFSTKILVHECFVCSAFFLLQSQCVRFSKYHAFNCSRRSVRLARNYRWSFHFISCWVAVCRIEQNWTIKWGSGLGGGWGGERVPAENWRAEIVSSKLAVDTPSGHACRPTRSLCDRLILLTDFHISRPAIIVDSINFIESDDIVIIVGNRSVRTSDLFNRTFQSHFAKVVQWCF